MPKILLTGFEPFGKVKVNPAQGIVEHIAAQNNPDIVTEILPVVYDKVGERLKTLMEEHEPDMILLLGVAQSREHISLERIAVNINDASIADNAGELVTGKPIIAGGPVGYWSTLPLEIMFDAIQAKEIAVKYSNHAGAYLCNHAFYIARHTLTKLNKAHIPCGFIHVPGLEYMVLEAQIAAVEACLEAINQQALVQESS